MSVKTTVLFPCRGLEDGLRRNLRSILQQDYGDYEVLLVTTAKDESLSVLETMSRESVRARVVIAEESQACSQKLANLLAGIERASTDSGYFVFVDSDGEVRPDFISEMVGPLSDVNVGMVTGWRWYVPDRTSFWSIVRSVWNAAALPFLVKNRHGLAFGGAMAVRRDIFENANMAGVWRRALSDDFTLAGRVIQMGLTVRFAPRCIAVSREGADFRRVLEWTNRQTSVTRVYSPAFWRLSACAYSFSMIVAICTAILGWVAMGSWGVAGCVLLYFCWQMLNAICLLRAGNELLPQETERGGPVPMGRYVGAAVAAQWLFGVNVIRSSLRRCITWRGITYDMRGPEDIVIVGECRHRRRRSFA